MEGPVVEVRALQTVTAAAVADALRAVLPAELADADPLVRRSDHADFQSNVSLSLAKKAGRKPRELAEQLAGALDARLAAEISGPGFINLSVADDAVWRQVAARLADDRLGVGSPELGQRTVIDYSAPNIAKEMHVGHLRTTIIGDALARVLDHLGSVVIRQNHLGDWGTQFGMLIEYLDAHPEAKWRAADLPEGDTGTTSALDGLYKLARAEFD
ncbi:MAG TPA: arginine--tRNA ligase, partial [Pseudonocardia sp.]|nr:arginine--tRNA ligase [Pseudonocardia sp.]